jgi:hypothetical protein
MVDVRSEKIEVKFERREHPRLELHCDTTIPGVRGIQTLTDISFGGCFIEAKIQGKVKIGQIITLNTKLPTEKKAIKVKAKIVSQKERGIGCQFISLEDDVRDAICTCFEMYKDTLPVGGQKAQWENECLETKPERQKIEPKKEIKQTPLTPISETNQSSSPKFQSQPSMLLKVGIGLVVVLLAGYFLTKTILRTSPEPEHISDARYAVVSTPQRYAIEVQANSTDSIADNDGKEAQNIHTSQIEEQNTQSQNVGLSKRQNVSSTETEPIEIAAKPIISGGKTSGVDLKTTPDLEATGTNDQKLLNLETETTTNIPIKELYSIEIGPVFRQHELKEATGILRDNGLDPEKIIKMETVKVIRLFEGSYTRDLAQERLKEIHKVIKSAFIIPEKGKLSIYVATYNNRDKALQKSQQLAKNNIKVTLVPSDIQMKGTKLVVKQVEQQNISTVQEQMSKLGLSVKIVKSG